MIVLDNLSTVTPIELLSNHLINAWLNHNFTNYNINIMQCSLSYNVNPFSFRR